MGHPELLSSSLLSPARLSAALVASAMWSAVFSPTFLVISSILLSRLSVFCRSASYFLPLFPFFCFFVSPFLFRYVFASPSVSPRVLSATRIFFFSSFLSSPRCFHHINSVFVFPSFTDFSACWLMPSERYLESHQRNERKIGKRKFVHERRSEKRKHQRHSTQPRTKPDEPRLMNPNHFQVSLEWWCWSVVVVISGVD